MSNRITKGKGLVGSLEVSTLKVGGMPITGFPFTGNAIFLDPVNGSDGNSGYGATQAKATLAAAYALLRTGRNDYIVVIGDGATTASIRLSAGFTWAKNAAHMIGIAAPNHISQRARLAPTAAVAGFANFFTVSGNGCYFANLQFFHGFDTGVAAQICTTVTGSRNVFENCHLGGMGDQESADDAGSRSLKISGGGQENLFNNCVIGLDTVTRGAANASIEFAGGAPRNRFTNCIFPFQTDAATPLGIIVSAAAGSDRWQLFENCLFINNIKSTSTVMTGLATLAASMGGLLLFKNCTLVGITDFGTDATSLAQIYVDGAPPTAATSGIAVNPS